MLGLLAEQVEGFAAITYMVSGKAQALEHAQNDQLVNRLIFHDEDTGYRFHEGMGMKVVNAPTGRRGEVLTQGRGNDNTNLQTCLQ